MKSFILKSIDLFYPPFSKFIPRQTFRYAASGGSNAGLNLLIFFLSYNFIFKSDIIHIGSISLTRYIAAYIVALSFSFPAGFLLNKYIVFQESDLKARTQLFRYATVTAMCSYFDYALLHFFVGYLGFWATPAQALITMMLALFSYLFQTHITFAKKKQKH